MSSRRPSRHRAARRLSLAATAAIAAALVGIAATTTATAAPGALAASPALSPLAGHPLTAGPSVTDATFFNDARTPGADPYVLHDPQTGYYYAYSTEGQDSGWHFAIYRSADMVTWEKAAPGALPDNDPKQWGTDWFWAPETYYNPRTKLYYMFYAAKSTPNAQRWFGFASFEEPCKIGVAVSTSAAGPFHNISDQPIDYNPYDPGYHDVNQIMGPDQKQPPATLRQGQTAPLGVYIPQIDPDVMFDSSGRIYLYYSRNAYRNWVWDTDRHKYIEESNILAVPLTSDWWNDPSGSTMPSIDPAYRNANAAAGGPPGAARRDGYVTVVDYDHDKQSWENADVDDYETTGGQLKDRRWEEGPEVVHSHLGGRDGYYLAYAANNSQGPQYAEGYATAASPLGPFHKSPSNPILQASSSIGEYSSGHGSFSLSPDGRQLYFVHHGRPTAETGTQRVLYTDEVHFSRGRTDPWGYPLMSMDESTSDRPVPSGVAPYRFDGVARSLRLRPGQSATIGWRVLSADRVPLALANPLNRVAAAAGGPGRGTVTLTPGADGASATVTAARPGQTTITLNYQRESADGGYRTVHQLGHGRRWHPVRIRIPVTIRR